MNVWYCSRRELLAAWRYRLPEHSLTMFELPPQENESRPARAARRLSGLARQVNGETCRIVI